MVDKVNGKAAAGEFLGSNLDFFIVGTTTDITVQATLEKVIETVSLNGQPVILAAPTGSGPYTLKFATEHTGAWTSAALITALSAAGVGLANVTCTVNGGLS